MMGVMSGVKSENCLSNKIGGTFQERGGKNPSVSHTCQQKLFKQHTRPSTVKPVNLIRVVLLPPG